MKLVVDSNVLFTFFWKNAIATDLFVFQNLELYTPQFSLAEIERYKEEIKNKAKMSEKEFQDIKKELQLLITFVPVQNYSPFLQEAVKVCPDHEDVDFFALALEKECPIWSNDKQLSKQEIVKILTTKEVIGLFE